ncbi:N-acyl homoserine lactonase family protein [Glaciibacter superstes]|uniref:N-acyl homoserine lactonase family protein n=1 Tax=Glaciibacter superstes TaxID=501023 RepID=UPI0003B5C13D|nr:N-acyl homoserine lactonase family protein [Glaciibacter superstes]
MTTDATPGATETGDALTTTGNLRTNTGTRVLQVKYGERQVRLSDAFHDFEAHGMPDAEVTMDYNFWTVERDGRIALVDTGYDVSERDWLGEVSVLPVPAGLSLAGIDPLDVELVVLTHFHFDHIGWVHLFENARIVCSRIEYEYWIGKKRAGELAGEFTTAELLQPIEDAAEAGRLQFVDGEEEVFPGLSVTPIGGHCPGELFATIVDGGQGIILAADAAHFGIQIEQGWPFFAYTDLDDMLAGLAQIKALADATGWAVVPGHDPAVRTSFPAAPGEAGSVINVLMDVQA